MGATSAETLAELGVQIGGIFERRAQEAQLQRALPVMQTAFQQSIQDFDAGRSAAGYARIVDVAMQYPNNPMVQRMAQMAFNAGQAVEDSYLARERSRLRGGGGGGGGGMGLTDEQMDEYLTTGVIPAAQGPTDQAATTRGVVPPAPAPPVATTPQPPVVEPEAMPEEKEVDEDYKPKTGEQVIETPWLEAFGFKGLVGPAEYEKKVPKVSKTKTIYDTGRKSVRQTEEETTEKVNVTEATKFREDVAKGKLKFEELRANKQLGQIFENSGRDFGNIDLDVEGSGSDKTYTASIINPETNQTTDAELSEDEYNTLRYFKTEAQEFVSRPTVKLVRKKEEAAPTRGAQAAQKPVAQTQKFIEGAIYKQGGKRYRYTNGNFVEIQ